DAVTHAAVVNLVGDFLRIVREGGGFRRVESPWPGVHETLSRIIQVLDDLVSGTALVAELSHGVRDNKIGRQSVFGKNGRGRRHDCVDQSPDFRIAVWPHITHDIAGQHDQSSYYASG